MKPNTTTAAILSGLRAFDSAPAIVSDKFTAYAGTATTGSEDGLWQPMTDARIHAMVPLAGEGWWLFGARGLAAADLICQSPTHLAWGVYENR